MTKQITLKDIFNYLEKNKSIEKFDFFNLQENNPFFTYVIRELHSEDWHSLGITFAPGESTEFSLADLICNKSFNEALWKQDWFYYSARAFTQFRSGGCQQLLDYMWKTKQ